MSKYNYVNLNSSKMLSNINSLNIGIESDKLFINNELTFTKNINVNTINNKNILLPRKPEIYDANKLVLTNSTCNDFEYLQFNNRIIQTQFTQYRTDFTSSGSGWRPLPFSVTITPKNIHSKILISTAVYYGGSNTSADFGFRLYKKVGSGSFTEIPLAQNLDNDNKGSGVFMSNNAGVDGDNFYRYQTACVTNEFLDYPRTTDIIEYKLYCSPDLSDSSNSDVFYINRPSSSEDNYRLHSSSYIKAQEIEIYKYTDYEAPIVTEYFMNNQLYKIFTFLKDGKLVLPKDNICDYLIVGGGGGGGSSTNSSSLAGAGGGAGGLVYRENISLLTGVYNIKVGDGGSPETNGGDSYIQFNSLPLIGYGVGSNTFTITSSNISNISRSYNDDLNGDASGGNTFSSNSHTIKYDFGANNSLRVTNYKIFGIKNSSNTGHHPKSWILQGSNDDSTYTTLDTQSTITDWQDIINIVNSNISSGNSKASSNPSCSKNFNVSNITKYRYYKFTFSESNGSKIYIQEIALFGETSGIFEGVKGGGGSPTTGNGIAGGSGSGGRLSTGTVSGNAISYNNGSVSTNQGYIKGINQIGIFGNIGGIVSSSDGGGGGGAGAPGSDSHNHTNIIFSDYFSSNTLSNYTIGGSGSRHTETYNSSENNIRILTADNASNTIDYKFTNNAITNGIIKFRLMKTEDYPSDNDNRIYMYNSSTGVSENYYYLWYTGSAYATRIGKNYNGSYDQDTSLSYDFNTENVYFVFELIFNSISVEFKVDGVSKGIHNFSSNNVLQIDSFRLYNNQFDGKLDYIEIYDLNSEIDNIFFNSGYGGIGKRYNIRDGKTAVYYAGGGAGGKTNLTGVRSGGGLGGGGNGAHFTYNTLTDANKGEDGKSNTGGGGGGSYSLSTDSYRGGNGGSGIVIIRVPQNLKNTLNIPKATGGNISYYTLSNVNYCVHTFLDSGSFIPESSLQVDYLIVAGGGSGGSGGDQTNEGSGGGAGGLIYQAGITFTNSTYTITIGKGGSENSNGENSSISGSGLSSNYIAIGGGRGGHGDYPHKSSNNKQSNGANGGSGGGGGYDNGNGGSAIVNSGDNLIQKSFTPNQVGVFGNEGGDDTNVSRNTGGGGGGAGGPGQNGSLALILLGSGSGFGGIGKQYSIRTGSLEYYAGGGGGTSDNTSNVIGALGGLGGGGKGGGGLISSTTYQGTGNLIGEDGKSNTGGGGGGTLSINSVKGGDGGSGIVVIRYQL